MADHLYQFTGVVLVPVVTLVQADSPEEAERVARARAVDFGPETECLKEWTNRTNRPDPPPAIRCLRCEELR